MLDQFFLNIEEYVLIGNMKPGRPWMLAILKIICRFHAHPVHQNSVDILGPRYVGDEFYRVESSLVQSNSRSLRDLKS